VIVSGVPVLGYIHWTLLDNFEWIFGYSFHYGLRPGRPSLGSRFHQWYLQFPPDPGCSPSRPLTALEPAEATRG
jgi:hypothetical protein